MSEPDVTDAPTPPPSDAPPPGEGAPRPRPPVGGVVARYTMLRLLIFFGFLVVLWLLGLRSTDQQPLLLILAALGSMVVSFFFLRRDRDVMSDALARRMERRAERRRATGEDEDAEDAELDR